MRSNQKIFTVLGMLIVFLVISLRYMWIDPNLYQLRDDGIITLSHAKNWVDYGFIGINPSGGKVEGTSAPLQFLIYSGVYLFTGMGYAAFGQIMTAICTLLMGLSIALLFKDRKHVSLAFSFLFATFLSFQSSFIEWHGSGMENSITHALFLLTVVGFASMLWNEKIDYRWLIVVFLASISRIDSIFHLFPVWVLFGLFWWFLQKNTKGFLLIAYAMVAWATLHFCRFLYFGDWLPNTAYAQDISISHRLMDLIHLKSSAIEQFKFLSKQIYFSHGGHWLLFLIFLPFVDWKKKYSPLIVFSSSMIITALIYPAFFGPSRLDYSRTNTHMAVFVFVLIVSILLCLKKDSMKLTYMTFGIVIGFFIYTKTQIDPYYLCCDINGFDKTHAQFKQIATQEGIQRPTVANPDLGIMSWYKDMNIVDLGMIGTPFLARTKNPKTISNFIFDHVAPDLIESHEIWSCLHYNTIFMDPRFKANYLVVKEDFIRHGDSCGGKALPTGIWIRRDILKNSNSRERKLHDALTQSIDLSKIEDELKLCKENRNCGYVIRSVYRVLPEIKINGQYDQLVKIFPEIKFF
ncbi:MAG: hypothetical protein R2877_05570 [Bdellovibrionota bacterium]